MILGAAGYIFGSLPFAVWITQWVKGVDVRAAGSHHATTTNAIRQAGILPGLAVLVLDIGKGTVPVALAAAAGAPGWVIGCVSAAAVAGHCWPLFAGFRGGMGLATAGGGYLAVAPVAFFIILGLLIGLTLVIRHSARASVATGLLTGPVLWALGLTGPILWIAFMSGLVFAARFTVDWGREYRELWLDRPDKDDRELKIED